MFEFLFKYPASVFSKGQLVLASRWPAWLLLLLVILCAAGLAYPFIRMHVSLGTRRRAILWSLQAAFVSLLLLIIWQPALSISMLRPQQNIVAVLMDDSRSMAMNENGSTRRDQAVKLLRSGLLDRMNDRFQVRLYRTGSELERVSTPETLQATGNTTRLGPALERIADEASSLPIGAVVLMTDGADNAGGIGRETLNTVQRRHLPIHTIGFGRERLAHDVEITNVDVPQRALAGSRINVLVGLRQFGYQNGRAHIKVAADGAVLAARDVDLKKEGGVDTFQLIANVGEAGARRIRVSVDPLGGEENTANNALDRLITVDDRKPRILYIEGEPRWEFKFIRRAAELDPHLDLVTILRTTQNKIYRQGIASPDELAQGFPNEVEELFKFDGLIIGGVEAGYFTPAQQELIREFADRRGGGVLFLGGRNGLSDGGWAQSPVAEMLPVVLPNKKDTFHRDPANVELTTAGRDSILCRVDEDPDKNFERWRKLPFLANYQEPGTPKPGAVVLAEMTPLGQRRMPLLVTENFGRGRTALFATGGSWRWQMQQPLADMSHEMFWQQMLRWLVAGSTQPVMISTDQSVYTDNSRININAAVHDKSYAPASGARVEAHIIGPGGSTQNVELTPDPKEPGTYRTIVDAPATGSYVTEIVARKGDQEIGRDAGGFLREDGIAENFHLEQNRELLESLSAQTGGRYFTPSNARHLADEIAFSEAGISTRETRDLWNMPVFFLLALALRSGEWLLRRKWGVV